MSDQRPDWATDPEAQRFLRNAVEDMAPKLRNSRLQLSLVPADVGDAKFWVELGAAIMYDKPIVLVCFGQRRLPKKLRQVADRIIRIEEGQLASPSVARRVADAIQAILRDTP